MKRTTCRTVGDLRRALAQFPENFPLALADLGLVVVEPDENGTILYITDTDPLLDEEDPDEAR